MEIIKGIKIKDLALWLKEFQALIISDLHLGYEEYLQQKGILIPKFQMNEIILKLKKLISETKPKIIIINGDLKHEFGKVLRQEWQEILQLIDFLQQNCSQLILIKGNHDQILGPMGIPHPNTSQNRTTFIQRWCLRTIPLSCLGLWSSLASDTCPSNIEAMAVVAQYSPTRIASLVRERSAA